MIKQNLHTHSSYCDGKNSLEEMVLEAIQRQFNILGFSSHGYTPGEDFGMSLSAMKDYQQQVKKLKEKYKGQIQIFLGVEQDMLYRMEHPEDFDYIIGSKHYVQGKGYENGIDCSKEITENLLKKYYHNSFLEYAKDYYEDLKRMAYWPEVDIIGHLDLLMKYNEDESFISFSDPEYIQYACDAIDCLVEHNKIIEVNTGAMARGYRTHPYPDIHLLSYIKEKQGRITLTSDCHNKDYLDCGFDLSLNLIKKCGFTTLEVLGEDGFEAKSLSLFE